MYKLDDHLARWIKEFGRFESGLRANKDDYEIEAFKILYEASAELYLSILQPKTIRSTKAILTRSLIECYSDVYVVFRSDDPIKYAKKYVKYARKMAKLFNKQSMGYTEARDRGEVTTRPFALARKYQACWNGMNVTSRIMNIDNGKHVIAYYEFFSLFAHVNPSRQVYLKHFNDPVIANYPNYIMLIILQTFVVQSFIPEQYFVSLNQIAAEYAAEYTMTVYSPPYPEE